MRRIAVAATVLAATLAFAGPASTHDFDHPAPAFVPTVPPSPAFISSPTDAWELVATIPTGNPLTDLDFFTQKGEIYASVGTLAIGANAGGQTIVRLTESGEVTPTSVEFVSAHPSASCVSDPAAALGLQHDAEAAPKGDVVFNTRVQQADRRDAQLVLDATDNEGRCHDQDEFGLGQNEPQGGIEIIDVTDIHTPKELALISHIGEAHTVNVDPKRAHIAFAVTSDSVNVTCNADDTQCTRANEDPSSSQRFNLDGFEVIDYASCMNFPPLTPLDVKRMVCRPEVFRYRYPSALIALGWEVDALAGCHELEIYPNDRLTCASINATLYFDLSKAFDKNGTPNKFGDDHPKGTPLPCQVRTSMSDPPYTTGAPVIDCVKGENDQPLTVPGWIEIGAPALEGVQHLGTAFHQGRGGSHDSTQDVDVSHEAELTASRQFILTTDERGGGVTPPGAACVTSPGDVPEGNGGIHAYRVDKLLKTSPSTAQEAWKSYAKTPSGEKAIIRVPINTDPQSTLCTSHVFHQIPGQNRIFMGWYTQGTQVVDFTETANGRIEFEPVAYFIPSEANTWTSAVFKYQKNQDGSFTYWGATGDFFLGSSGRSAVDVWKVTLPAPPRPRAPGP